MLFDGHVILKKAETVTLLFSGSFYGRNNVRRFSSLLVVRIKERIRNFPRLVDDVCRRERKLHLVVAVERRKLEFVAVDRHDGFRQVE